QNNAHFGLFQFKLATWRSVGGSGNPIDASPREQFDRAKKLQAKAGWGQWACA
ncbi:G5 domain-containing protein, partial [Burkholderia multivorans]